MQNFYNMADTAIVGRTIGPEALASVGATGIIFSFFVSIISGLMNGFAVVAGQKYGAGKFDELKKVYVNGFIITLAISLTGTVLGTVFAKKLLIMMNTPADILESSASYLRIIFAGISTTMLYNFSGEMLRALGDSKKPFLYLMIACILNIVLDLFFILVLKSGVEGAAIATVISQALSAVLCFAYTFQSVEYFRFRKHEFRCDRRIRKECLHIGLPNSLINGVILGGMIIMQIVTNGFGTDFVAAYTASGTVSNFLIFPCYAFTASIAVYAAQNFGAGKIDRMKKGIRDTLFMMIGFYAVLSLLMFFVSKPIFGLLFGYTGEIVSNAAMLLNIKLATIFFLIPLCFYKSVLQAIGKPLFPTISSFLEIAVRIIVSTQITKVFGFVGIGLTDPLTWIVTCIFFIVAYTYEIRKVEKSIK